MLDDGAVERRVRLLRPMERPAIPLDRAGRDPLAGSRTRHLRPRLEGRARRDARIHRKPLHIVTGLLLPIWKRLPRRAMPRLPAADR